MATILIQVRIDEFSTPDLYAEMIKLPAGNARTGRLKAMANEAIIVRRAMNSMGRSDPWQPSFAAHTPAQQGAGQGACSLPQTQALPAQVPECVSKVMEVLVEEGSGKPASKAATLLSERTLRG